MKDARIYLVVLLSTLGMFFLLYTLTYIVKSNPGMLPSLLSGGNKRDGGTNVLLGLLAIVMTLVTGVVVTVSRNALSDIRDVKLSWESKFRAIEIEASELEIAQLRILLLYECHQEIKVAKSGSDVWLFRDTMQTLYSRYDQDSLKNYLYYLSECYDRQKHGTLLGLEKNYLDKLLDHFRAHPEKDKDGELLRLINTVRRKV